MDINFIKNEKNHLEATSVNGVSIFNSARWVWVLIGFWLVYTVAMLWHFKEQTDWIASVCKVAS